MTEQTFWIWKRNFGIPTIKRWDKIRKCKVLWADDPMLLAWKLEMARIDHERAYGGNK